MNKKITTILVSLCFLLSSCTGGGLSELKRSSNNQLIDLAGFEGQKRRPLYNKKYIKKAKQNIALGDFEEEEEIDDEIIDSSRRNISMYKKMVEKSNGKDELKSKVKDYQPTIYDSEYDVDIVESRKKITEVDEYRSKEDLENEIDEIKKLLLKTKDEIAKAKCPYSEPSNSPAKQSVKKKPKVKEVSEEIEDELKSVSELQPQTKETKKPAEKKKRIVQPETGAMSAPVVKD